MAAETALTLITDTLLDMGVIAGEATPRASQAQQLLRKMNRMFKQWNIEGLLTYGLTPYILTLTPGQQQYTIGPGGDIDIPLPTEIQGAFVRDISLPLANQEDYPLNKLNDQQWQRIAFKNMEVQWPNIGIWFNMTYPLIEVNIWPIPTTSQYAIVIWIENKLSPMTLSTVIALPDGYEDAIIDNLYVKSARSFQIELTQEDKDRAINSKAIIQAQNLQINELIPTFGSGWYDIVQNRYL